MTPTSQSFRCPTCNASQSLSAECRRCKCDLSMLVAARQHAESLVEQCLRHLSTGEIYDAERAALRRWELSPDTTAARLLAVAYLLQGRYQAALDIRHRMEAT